MIAGIRGTLIKIDDDSVFLDTAGVIYKIYVSRITADRLSDKTGKEIFIHTIYYIESNIGIGNLVPKLIGFLNNADMEFFSVFTSVQGISVKKALKAFVIPVKDIARAIETGDVAVLKKLPEIGAKTAQKIVMELKGKTMDFAMLSEDELSVIQRLPENLPDFQNEALSVLVQMQYSQSEAESLIKRALIARPGISSSEELIQEVFKTHGSK